MGLWGPVVGDRVFSRDLTVRANINGDDQVRLVSADELVFRVADADFVDTIEAVGASEGVIAFQVLNSVVNEIIAGQVTAVSKSVSSGSTTVTLTVDSLLGRDVLDRNLDPSLGSTNNIVTLGLWRRAAAVTDPTEDIEDLDVAVDGLQDQISDLGALASLDVVPVERGGTGGESAIEGREGLGLGSAAVEDVGTEEGDIPALGDGGVLDVG